MSDRGALGIPVSKSLLLAPGMRERELRQALAAIDRIHGDGLLVQITVQPDSTIAEQATYDRIEPHGVPYRIAIRPRVNHPGLLLVHEIGHFLDHQGIGVPGEFASLGGPELANWRELIVASRAISELNEFRQHLANPESRQFLDYLLGYDELWARSYEQYVASRSHDSELFHQLSEARHPPFWPSRVPRLWNEQEFDPIGQAIDALFRSLQWMK
jgi:hypothetical protein